MSLSAKDLEHYKGERGRRGNKLPRGLQRVDGVELESPVTIGDVSSSDDQPAD